MNIPMMDAAGVNSGQAFLNAELERLHPTINEPLIKATWSRDIPYVTGGGFPEYVSNLFAEYASAGTNELGIINGATDVIPLIQANFSKDLAQVFPWANNFEMKWLNVQRLQMTGRSIQPVLETGIQASWNKTLDVNVYTGLTLYGKTGLINNANVTASNAVNGAGGTATWATKTPDEILADINTVLNNAWIASEYTVLPNRLLIPPTNLTYLITNRIPNTNKSILSYLMNNNIMTAQTGEPLTISDCRQLIGAGAGSTNRMVAYNYDERWLQFDITQPLLSNPQGVMWDLRHMSYLTNFVGAFSEIQIKYPQVMRYLDGI